MQKSFTEYVNKDMCDYLLSLPLYKLQKVVYDDNEVLDSEWNVQSYLNQVKGFLQKMKDNNYQLNQTYKFSKSMKDKGRLYVDGFGIQNCQYRLRGALLKGICYDYDMVNAHPTILLNIMKKEFPNIDVTYLRAYVNSRNDVLFENKLSKVEILKVMNKDSNRGCKNPWLKKFHNQIIKMQDAIYDKYKDEYKSDKKFNVKGSVMNKHICVYENDIIQKVVAEFSQETDVHSIIFDGFTCDNSDMTDKLNEFTESDNIKWVVKKHCDDIEICDFDEDEISNSYDAVKNEFEKNNFVCNFPLCYCTEIKSFDNITTLNKDFKTTFVDRYQNLYFTDFVFDKKTKEYTEKKTKFITRWLDDENRRSFESMEFIPPGTLKCPPNVYNLFRGFKYEHFDENKDKFPKIYDMSKDELKNDKDVKIFLDHIRILAGEDKTEEVSDYIEKYLAHLIQFPSELPRTALVLKSLEGIGKNVFFEMFTNNVLGEEYLLSTANPENLLGRFNMLNNKFVVIMNVAQGKDMFSNCEQIKSLITEPHINWEDKGKPLIKLKSYMRMLFFSNNDTPVKVSVNDRRNMVMECNDKIISNGVWLKHQSPEYVEYFNTLTAYLKNKEALLKFTLYLKMLEVDPTVGEKWTPSGNRIITNFYSTLKSVNISPIHRWLTNFITESLEESENSIIKCPSINLYKIYETYMSSKNFKPVTLTAFGSSLKKIDGISKGIVQRKTLYSIDITETLDSMKKGSVIETEEYEYLKEYLNKESKPDDQSGQSMGLASVTEMTSKK